MNEVVYEKSIDTKMSDLDVRLEVVSNKGHVKHCATFGVEYLGNR